MQEKKIKYDNSIIEHWKNRKPFNLENPDLWPEVPNLWDIERYRKELIPEIIRCGGIPKKDLIPGETYLGSCRNTSKAVWDGEKFKYTRVKFGFTYEESIHHFEDDLGDGADVFMPVKIWKKTE